MDFNRREMIEDFKAQGSTTFDISSRKQQNRKIYQKFKNKYGLSKLKNIDAKTLSNNTRIKMMLKGKIDF